MKRAAQVCLDVNDVHFYRSCDFITAKQPPSVENICKNTITVINENPGLDCETFF